MKEGKRIEELWQEYWFHSSKNTSIALGGIQYLEMRKSFYAGAFAFYTEQTALINEPDKVGVEFLEHFVTDFTEYVKSCYVL